MPEEEFSTVDTLRGVRFVVAIPVAAEAPAPQQLAPARGYPKCTPTRSFSLEPVQNSGDVEPHYSDVHFFVNYNNG